MSSIHSSSKKFYFLYGAQTVFSANQPHVHLVQGLSSLAWNW